MIHILLTLALLYIGASLFLIIVPPFLALFIVILRAGLSAWPTLIREYLKARKLRR